MMTAGGGAAIGKGQQMAQAWDGMSDAEREFLGRPELPSAGGDEAQQRLMELTAENQRLQRIVTELLMRNQQLREKATL